jgi:hypothetical protein
VGSLLLGVPDAITIPAARRGRGMILGASDEPARRARSSRASSVIPARHARRPPDRPAAWLG